MENISATPDLLGEEKPGAERGAVFINFVLALESIAIIVSADFVPCRHTHRST